MLARDSHAAIGPVERFFQLSLLGLLASGYLAVAGSGYLDRPTIVLTACGLVLRALVILRLVRWELPGNWISAATLAYMGFYPLDYLYISGEFIPATVHLIFFLAVVRILTARTNRDYFFVKIIAFMELLAATLLSANLNFFVFLTLFIVFGVATFCCSEIRKSAEVSDRLVVSSARRFHLRLTALALSMTAGILVMTAGFFFVLPRTARAAFRNVIAQRYHLPGFSNEMTLGQMGVIQQQSTPVMHVRIESAQGPHKLKWRGASLSHFDGKRWFNSIEPGEGIRVEKGTARLADVRQRRRTGKRLSYEVRINSMDMDALFFAGTPEFLQIALPLIYRMPGDSFRTGLGLSEGTHYMGFSHISAESAKVDDPDPLDSNSRGRYLALPRLDERIHTLAFQLTSGAATDAARAQLIERHLRTAYSYTTELLQSPVADPLAHFLFERRKGHCEYFASAMAVMLREIGIPARVATGFQSGVFNPMTGWHLIRASDAHSWVEAYLPERGWTTFDPTPPDLNPPTSVLWSQLALYVDAADMFWRQWILQYDLDRQLRLASSMGTSSSKLASTKWMDAFAGNVGEALTAGAKALRPYAGVAIACLVMGGAALLAAAMLLAVFRAKRQQWRLARGQVAAGDAALLYHRMLRILRRRGYEKPAWLTATEFARVLPASPMAVLVEEATAAYQELRFGGKPDAAAKLLQLLEELEVTR
jgi:hypothetical protein